MLATGFIAMKLACDCAKPSAESYEGKTLSYQLIQTTSFCNRQLQTPTTGCTATEYFFASADLYRSSSILRLFLASVPAGPFAPADLTSSAEHDVVTNDIIIDGPLRCSSWFPFDVPAAGYPGVGRKMLATGFIAMKLACDCAKPSAESYEGKTLSYQLIQTTSFCNRQLQTPTAGYTTTEYFFASADLYRSNSILRLFLASIPAGPFAPADLTSSAEHDVVTNEIIIDGPLRCSSWFPFDVPAGSSSSSSRLQLDTATAVEQTIEHVTATATDINEQFAVLRTYISENSIKQLRTQSKIGDLQNSIFSKIYTYEKAAVEARVEQDQSFRSIFKSLRQGAHTDTAALSVEMHELKKSVRAQNAFVTADLADLRKDVKNLKADLSKEFDDKLAVIRNDLLEFRVDTQGQLASLGTNLSELIAFITKGSDDKKGEESSSHGRGQPPPGSGGSKSEPSRKRGTSGGSSGSRQKSWRYWLNE
ncbi:hypothetical protein F511_33022 [Dorcoceras hygrometricum]|uniref:Uncharacterized protein n=1 Tax=Dorcoceras hygrometricum TaxID=472368 RepID=A0A2Z7CJA1_9LAMI|nr:hypothetical protein F511_33022 [Dorcoceras hygrometricum]